MKTQTNEKNDITKTITGINGIESKYTRETINPKVQSLKRAIKLIKYLVNLIKKIRQKVQRTNKSEIKDITTEYELTKKLINAYYVNI